MTCAYWPAWKGGIGFNEETLSALGSASARVPQACPRVGQPLAFPVQTPVAFGNALFRCATLMFDFYAALLFCRLASDGVAGFFLARCVGAVRCCHDAQGHADAQQCRGPRTGQGDGCAAEAVGMHERPCRGNGWMGRVADSSHPAMQAVALGSKKYVFRIFG